MAGENKDTGSSALDNFSASKELSGSKVGHVERAHGGSEVGSKKERTLEQINEAKRLWAIHVAENPPKSDQEWEAVHELAEKGDYIGGGAGPWKQCAARRKVPASAGGRPSARGSR